MAGPGFTTTGFTSTGFVTVATVITVIPGTVPLGNVCGNSAITLNGLTGSKAVTIGDVHS